MRTRSTFTSRSSAAPARLMICERTMDGSTRKPTRL